MRSVEGCIILATVINRAVLEKYLLRLPGQTEQSVAALLDPTDHQNVPRAVKLLKAIVAIADLDTSDMSPSERVKMRSLRLLSQLWDSVLQAFINPDLSLSEQLTSLSAFAHLAYALYTMHGTSFMTGQLYSDMQQLVKAAFVCVARQTLLDKTKAFYLYQLGSDRLEELFAEIRTQTHDRNCNIAQLAERLSIAVDIVKILNEYPWWDRGHRRRSFTGTEGTDHVNPLYYTGDMVVANVCLENVWSAGMHRATEMLKEAGISFNFRASLQRAEGSDFMRPNGRTYPGVSTDPDRSQPQEETPEVLVQSCLAAAGLQEIRPNRNSTQVKTPPSSDAELAVDYPPPSRAPTATSRDDCLSIPDARGENPKLVHKVTILDQIFNLGVLSRLSVDRLRRVRGYTKDFREVSEGNPSRDKGVSDDTALKVGSIVLIPVRAHDLISAAFCEITSLEVGGKRVCQILESDLEKADATSKAYVTGQVLDMKLESGIMGDLSEFSNDSETSRAPGDYMVGSILDPRFLWTGEYIRFDAGTGASSTNSATSDNYTGSRTTLKVKTPAHLAYPLHIHTDSSSLLAQEDRRALDLAQQASTYSVSTSCLQHIISAVYESLDAGSLTTALPKHGQSAIFPYYDRDSGEYPFLLAHATTLLAEQSAKQLDKKVGCHQCGKLIKPVAARGHVGEHILRAVLGIRELALKEQVCDSPVPSQLPLTVH